MVDGLASKLGDNHLNDVGSMEETGELNHHGNVESKDGKVVVDKVEHHVRGVDLSGELTKHGSEENHGDSGNQKDLENNLRKVKESSSCKRGTAQVDNKDKQDNHELTAHEVAIKVISLVGNLGAHVCLGV